MINSYLAKPNPNIGLHVINDLIRRGVIYTSGNYTRALVKPNIELLGLKNLVVGYDSSSALDDATEYLCDLYPGLDKEAMLAYLEFVTGVAHLNDGCTDLEGYVYKGYSGKPLSKPTYNIWFESNVDPTFRSTKDGVSITFSYINPEAMSFGDTSELYATSDTFVCNDRMRDACVKMLPDICNTGAIGNLNVVWLRPIKSADVISRRIAEVTRKLLGYDIVDTGGYHVSSVL